MPRLRRLLSRRPPTAILALCLVGLTVAGCAGPAYRPFRGGVGYSEAQLAPNRYDIIFEGTRSMSVGRATELAKVRAAELAMSQGTPFFVIEERDLTTRLEVDSTGPYSGYGQHGHGHGSGVGVGINLGGGPDVDSRPVSVLRVRLLDEATPDALDAAAVLREAIARDLVDRKSLTIVPV